MHRSITEGDILTFKTGKVSAEGQREWKETWLSEFFYSELGGVCVSVTSQIFSRYSAVQKRFRQIGNEQLRGYRARRPSQPEQTPLCVSVSWWVSSARKNFLADLWFHDTKTWWRRCFNPGSSFLIFKNRPDVSRTGNLSVCLFICLSVYLSVCLSVCLCVSLCSFRQLKGHGGSRAP